MPEITIDGRVYVYTGDYPDGQYAMWPKPLGPEPETDIEIARKILQAGDIQTLNGTPIGRALLAILKIVIGV